MAKVLLVVAVVPIQREALVSFLQKLKALCCRKRLLVENGRRRRGCCQEGWRGRSRIEGASKDVGAGTTTRELMIELVGMHMPEEYVLHEPPSDQ
jgi:hypothetical protein